MHHKSNFLPVFVQRSVASRGKHMTFPMTPPPSRQHSIIMNGKNARMPAATTVLTRVHETQDDRAPRPDTHPEHPPDTHPDHPPPPRDDETESHVGIHSSSSPSRPRDFNPTASSPPRQSRPKKTMMILRKSQPDQLATPPSTTSSTVKSLSFSFDRCAHILKYIYIYISLRLDTHVQTFCLCQYLLTTESIRVSDGAGIVVTCLFFPFLIHSRIGSRYSSRMIFIYGFT
jgi:hypothetical protein